ncbi:iron deficiency-induced protein A [Synechococcus sp. A15-127]|nr:iron deficiency-induced protein A [Synechococcus sp. A15-127]
MHFILNKCRFCKVAAQASLAVSIGILLIACDSKNRWFGFTRRLRAPMFNAEKVKANEVSRYEDLAAPALKGRLSLRNRRSVYHQSLVAFMLDTAGEQEMTQWIQGMMANVAQPVFSSDTPMVGAVAQGDYGVALANSYYLGRMQAGDKGDADLALSSKVSAQRLGELNAKAVELMAANRWQ